MSRKYTPPPKKKKGRIPPTAAHHARTPGAAPAAAPAELSITRPPVAAARAAPAPGTEAVKYETLPSELRRVALLTAITIVILIVLWLIFR